MSAREREGLIRRIRQIRRTAAAERGSPAQPEVGNGQIRALEARVAHLEQMVEGLQDSVHRESERQSKRIAELETRIEPDELSKALSDNARERGL
jgi:uncharacterized coiled-coil protein SlyX